MVKRIMRIENFSYTPFSFAIVYGWIVYGLLSINSFLFESGDIHVGMIFQPPVVEVLSGIFIVVGASLMILSSRKWERVNTSWTLDKIGMFIAGGGWSGYLLGIALADPVALWRAAICVIFLVALIVRYIFTYAYHKFVEARVSKWNSGGPTHKQ